MLIPERWPRLLLYVCVRARLRFITHWRVPLFYRQEFLKHIFNVTQVQPD